MWGHVGSILVVERHRFRSHERSLNFYDDALVIAGPDAAADKLPPHDLRDRDPDNELVALWDIERVAMTGAEIELDIRGSHPLVFETADRAGAAALLQRVFGEQLLSS